MPMIKKSITVTDKQEEWLQAQLASGQYASDSEIFRDLIRKEQTRNDQIQSIRAALLEGEASGISEKTPDQIREDVLKRLRTDGEL